MTLNTALAAVSGLVSLAFGLATLDRWTRRRRPHELAWTVAMALFFVAAMSLWWAEARGWSAPSFRMFFAFGAVINVPWLALGTVYLLAGKKAGDMTMRVLLVFSGFALGAVVMAPVSGVIEPGVLPTGKEHFGVLPRVLAAVGSAVPAVVIFAGAAWSAWRVLRGSNPALTSAAVRNVTSARRLAAGNVLIAAGAAVLSASGTFAGRLGADTSFAVTLSTGISVLFAGFLVASNATTPRGAAQRSE
ncbi:MAG: hypothetical protein ACKODP_07500 [Actinomycetota bacterium]